MLYIHTTEYYSAIKKNEILSFAAAWIVFEDMIVSEISQAKTNNVWYLLHLESKKWQQSCEYNNNKQKTRLIENRLVSTSGERKRGRGNINVGDEEVQTII